MEHEINEYVTFYVTTRDGSEVEMAVVDEFDFEHKHYVVSAVVKDDVIQEDGTYIYRCIIKGDDFTVEKIKDADEYQKIAQAYMDMDEE